MLTLKSCSWLLLVHIKSNLAHLLVVADVQSSEANQLFIKWDQSGTSVAGIVVVELFFTQRCPVTEAKI